MSVNIDSETVGSGGFPSDFERVRSELEQARVALEDMELKLAELGAVNAGLRAHLEQETTAREALEERLRQLRTAQITPSSPASSEIVLRQQLSTALEELHVMAEELTLAQEALQKAGP